MRVFLNALGLVNALGCGTDAVRAALGAVPDETLTLRGDLVPGRRLPIGAVRAALPPMPPGHERFASRNNRLLAAAFADVAGAVNALRERYGAARIGVVLGTSTSGIAEGEDAITRRMATGAFPDDFDYAQQEIGSPSEFLRNWLELEGPAWTVSTACTSSAKSLAAARRLIRAGLADAAIAGGADALCRLTVRGFTALETTSPNVCNPFSRNRDGINIGEGAALFLVSHEPGPVELLGVGESSDAYHVSAPDPSGAGAEAAMRTALADAGVAADAVDYLNLHGTGTPQNDLMESHAVARVFGCDVAASSTKPLTGHTLGAAGATEAGLCWLALTGGGEEPLPVHHWDGVRDPELAPLHFVAAGERADCRIAASNGFAFGGSNVTLVLARHEH